MDIDTTIIDNFISILFKNQKAKVTETWLIIVCGISILVFAAILRYINVSSETFIICRCLTILLVGKILFGNKGVIMALVFPLQYLIGVDFLDLIFS